LLIIRLPYISGNVFQAAILAAATAPPEISRYFSVGNFETVIG
jgi:hypothetical protein